MKKKKRNLNLSKYDARLSMVLKYFERKQIDEKEEKKPQSK